MSSSTTFVPDANEGPNHREAKTRLAELCTDIGMQAFIEAPVKTEEKTYFCDVLAAFTISGSKVQLDLEVEDHDHSKHDFDDADNKVKELNRYFIKTVWFKSSDIIGKNAQPATDILVKIFNEMIDGPRNYRNPRFNI